MSAVANLIEEIDKLSLPDLGELIGFLEKKWNVSAKPVPMTVLKPVEEAVVIQTQFDVTLGLKFDTTKKIAIIKEVKNITGLSLGDAKALVEGGGIVKKSVADAEAQELKGKLEGIGAEVILV